MKAEMKTAGWQCVIGSLLLAVWAGEALGNNIRVTALSLEGAGTPAGTVDVQFTVSWSNSWRAAWTEVGANNVSGANLDVENWDAAWVFIKWRDNNASAWSHATLDPSAHTAPDGVTIAAADGTGAFIYRSAAGSGGFEKTVKLRWNRQADGAGSEIDVSVQAIEMVYVAQGAFKVGSGGTESGSFTDGAWVSGASIPFMIAGEGELLITNSAGNLWGTVLSGNNGIGGTGTLSNAFPKGYSAFYCMKYPITQGQYADFLNLLTLAQAGNRYDSNKTGSRYTISGSHPGFTASAPDRACNFLNWEDGATYAAWAGLRPMTELEYEKVCRGPLNPVPGEYAWGSTGIFQTTNYINDGTSAEAALPATANCTYGGSPSALGPIRAGAFATANSGRVAAGASYWGVMELSGNLWKRPVSVGHAKGRAFMGSHGAGTVTLPADWPAADSNGSGVRGGDYTSQSTTMRVSDRSFAALAGNTRYNVGGWRGVRKAP